ncbi:MAG: hypothetical protein ACYTFI_06470 [Planctomycetota bacterium]
MPERAIAEVQGHLPTGKDALQAGLVARLPEALSAAVSAGLRVEKGARFRFGTGEAGLARATKALQQMGFKDFVHFVSVQSDAVKATIAMEHLWALEADLENAALKARAAASVRCFTLADLRIVATHWDMLQAHCRSLEAHGVRMPRGQ